MQSKIITCFNQKGGSGKTTTAAQLADTFGRRGYSTTVADIDRQSTASFLWGTQRAVFAEAQARHCAIQWLDPNAKTPAATELNALADEISGHLGIPKKNGKAKGRA